MPNSPRPRPRPSSSGFISSGRGPRPDSTEPGGREGDEANRRNDRLRGDGGGVRATGRPGQERSGGGYGADRSSGSPRSAGGRYGAGREQGSNPPARYGNNRSDGPRGAGGARSSEAGSSRYGGGSRDHGPRDGAPRGGSSGRTGGFGGGSARAAGRGGVRPDSRGGRGGEFVPARPQTAAERRSSEVNARRDAARDEQPLDREAVELDRWEPEQWEDQGSVRELARDATSRARGGARAETSEEVRERRLGDPTRLEPSWVAEIERESDSKTSARYMERLAAATEALERDRYTDALRMVQSVLKNLPNVGAGHEVAGIALYRLGEWRKAAAELEQARRLHPSPEQLPVLADCYRALRRYHEVDELWHEIRNTSPAPSVMAEGRIVAAGALADQGDIAGAIKLLIRVADAPKRVRDYHLKQWYVIADLYDRSGDVVKARNFFKRVAAIDPRYADVSDRLAMLGRR